MEYLNLPSSILRFRGNNMEKGGNVKKNNMRFFTDVSHLGYQGNNQ